MRTTILVTEVWHAINSGCVKKLSNVPWKLRCSGAGRLFHFGLNRRQFSSANAQVLARHACQYPNTPVARRLQSRAVLGRFFAGGPTHIRDPSEPAKVLPGDTLPGELLVQISDTAVGTLVLGCLFSMLGAQPERSQIRRKTADGPIAAAAAASNRSTRPQAHCPTPTSRSVMAAAGCVSSGSRGAGVGGSGSMPGGDRSGSSSSSEKGDAGRWAAGSQSAGAPIMLTCADDFVSGVNVSCGIGGGSRSTFRGGGRGDNADDGRCRSADHGDDGAGHGGRDGAGGKNRVRGGSGGGGDSGGGWRGFGAGEEDEGRSSSRPGIAAGLCLALGAAAAVLARLAKLPSAGSEDLSPQHHLPSSAGPELRALQVLQKQLQPPQQQPHLSPPDDKEAQEALQQQWDQQDADRHKRPGTEERHWEQPQLQREPQPSQVGRQMEKRPQQECIQGSERAQQMREQLHEQQWSRRVTTDQPLPPPPSQQQPQVQQTHLPTRGAANGFLASGGANLPDTSGGADLFGQAVETGATEGAIRIRCRNFSGGGFSTRGHVVSVGMAVATMAAAAEAAATSRLGGSWPAFPPTERDAAFRFLTAELQLQAPAGCRTKRHKPPLPPPLPPPPPQAEHRVWRPAAALYDGIGMCPRGDSRGSFSDVQQPPPSPARQQQQQRAVRSGCGGCGTGGSSSTSSGNADIMTERGGVGAPLVLRHRGVIGGDVPSKSSSSALLPTAPVSEGPKGGQPQLPGARPASRDCGAGSDSNSNASARGVPEQRGSAAPKASARRGLIVRRDAPSGLGDAQWQRRREVSRLPGAGGRVTDCDSARAPHVADTVASAAAAAAAAAHQTPPFARTQARPATALPHPRDGDTVAVGQTAARAAPARYPSGGCGLGAGVDLAAVSLCDEISALGAVQKGLEGAHRRAGIWLATGLPGRAGAAPVAAAASP